MPSPAHIPSLLEQAKQFLNDPAKVGWLFAGIAWGIYHLAKLIIKDPTKIWSKDIKSIPATPKSELEQRMASLELEQAQTRAERAEWRYEEMQAAYVKVQAENDKLSGQLVAARSVLEESEERHVQQCEAIKETWERDLRMRDTQKEAGERAHLRRIAEIEAENAGLKTRLAFYDSQIEMKIERFSAALSEERVKLASDTERPPGRPLKKNPR